MNWEKPWVLGLVMYGTVVFWGLSLLLLGHFWDRTIRLGLIILLIAAFTIEQVIASKTGKVLTRRTKWRTVLWFLGIATAINLLLTLLVVLAYPRIKRLNR